MDHQKSTTSNQILPSFRTEAVEGKNGDFNQIQGSMLKYMSIANEHTDAFHVAHFDFKDPVNAT